MRLSSKVNPFSIGINRKNNFKPIYYPSETTFLILRHTVRQPFDPRFTLDDHFKSSDLSYDRTFSMFALSTAV